MFGCSLVLILKDSRELFDKKASFIIKNDAEIFDQVSMDLKVYFDSFEKKLPIPLIKIITIRKDKILKIASSIII